MKKFVIKLAVVILFASMVSCSKEEIKPNEVNQNSGKGGVNSGIYFELDTTWVQDKTVNF